MHPVELLGHRSRLVGLQRADEVPVELAAQVAKRLDLGQAFLHVVLAEGAGAGLEGFTHGGGREGLADHEQPHGVRRAAGRDTCRSDTSFGDLEGI